jgi:hypothetical protein
MSNATASTHHAAPTEGAFPSRGRVSMFCLIAAEAARFSIFVLAYLFYIGKRGVIALAVCPLLHRKLHHRMTLLPEGLAYPL